jgi:hypothetical protein
MSSAASLCYRTRSALRRGGRGALQQHPQQCDADGAIASLRQRRALSTAHNDGGDDDTKPPPPLIKNPFNAKAHFDWRDPLKLFSSSLLTDEELAIKNSANTFCQQQLQPRILQANRHEITLDHDLMRQFGDMGMLGVSIPEFYGGAGLGYVAYGLIAAEVERVDSSYRSAMSELDHLLLFDWLVRSSVVLCLRCLGGFSSSAYIVADYYWVHLSASSFLLERCPI